MLLGILYTASNAKQRAERFYELVQFNLDSQIFTNDWEFQKFIPLVSLISSCILPQIYNKNVKYLNENKKEYEEMYPVLKGHEWKPVPFDVQHEAELIYVIQTQVTAKMLIALFGTKTFQEKDAFISKVETRFNGYLRPEDIRDIVNEEWRLHTEKESSISVQ